VLAKYVDLPPAKPRIVAAPVARARNPETKTGWHIAFVTSQRAVCGAAVPYVRPSNHAPSGAICTRCAAKLEELVDLGLATPSWTTSDSGT
jgi:hypothetical protein